MLQSSALQHEPPGIEENMRGSLEMRPANSASTQDLSGNSSGLRILLPHTKETPGRKKEMLESTMERSESMKQRGQAKRYQHAVRLGNMHFQLAQEKLQYTSAK
mmetsp:Transcript_8120/g.36089  ORF Transcript_8120/g.36089 Transcript_8120/m.36089 type:complete len:104 (-) Transcript_8120:5487-5798(-)